MTIDGDAAYRVLLARDARFDGRLFVGVTSTGVYCRPICRVRTPARRNCRFFESPAQAEAQDFRPCLKCRPEIAPGPGLPWSVMDASRTLALQAAAAIGVAARGGELPSMSELAVRLGVSDRHLRRIFLAEHGVTPLQFLQTARLLLAKQLLTDTAMPMADVATASGFKSLRRFNAAFAGSYRMSPSRLRRTGTLPGARRRSLPERPAADALTSVPASTAATARDASPATPITVTLGYRAPYDHRAMLAFFAWHTVPGVEAVDGMAIRRTLRAGALGIVEAQAPGWIEARFEPGRSCVRIAFAPSLGPASGAVIASVRRWLDLDASPDAIDAALLDLPGDAGLRLPGSLDAFELAVRAVLGQQVTVAAAHTLARRLVERFGSEAATPWPGLRYCFPAPGVLAAAPLGRIAELGIIASRAGAIQALARDWQSLASLAAHGAPADALVTRLCELPGIGPWTAGYVAMRALGWPDAFPHGDIAALKAMRQLFGTATPGEAAARAEAWRPWRAYALLRLWNTLYPNGVRP